jgi:hypothetical protein
MPELPALDTEHANAARMYDYFLGGMHNFEVDRQAARAAEDAWPGATMAARANRSFLRRAVRYLASECGISQFLDLGSGVPTEGNVHEIAQSIDPRARVVYVDNEPVAVKASGILLEHNPNAEVIRADLTDVNGILRHPTTRRLLDFTRPIAVMLVSVLHFVLDDQLASEVVRRYVEAMPSGSYLTISHVADPSLIATSTHSIEKFDAVYAKTTNPTHWRSRAEIAAFFEGTELVPPGLAHVLDWRPASACFGDQVLESYRGRMSMTVGVGRKP